MCVFVILGTGLWGVELVGVKAAVHALWPSLDKEVAWITAGVIGGLLALLIVLGAEAAKHLIAEYQQDQRALRWQARKAKQAAWSSRLRNVSQETPRWDLEEIYWDGIELQEEFNTGRDSAKLRSDLSHFVAEKLKAEEFIKGLGDHRNEKFNEALEALKNVLDQSVN